jgi:hypothetical protein
MENQVKKQKPFYKKTWVIIVGVIIFIVIIANLGGKDENSTSSVGDSTASTEEVQKQWVELVQFKGSGDKKSEIFTYGGGKARIRYEFTSGDMGALYVYVVKEGEDIMRDGGFPEVMLDGPESGESNLSHLKKGNYYLNVTSANGKWVVIVEEFK